MGDQPTLPQKAQDLLKGNAPEKFRRAVATGTIPLPPEELVSCVAVVAAKDPDPELQEKARETLQDLPQGVRDAAVSGALAAPIFRVLWTYMTFKTKEREQLALNKAVPNDVLTALAEQEEESSVIEIIANNQQRMMQCVPLVEALLENPSLGPAMKNKVEEFFSRAYAGRVLLSKGLATKEELEEAGEWNEELDALAKEAPDEDEEDDIPDDFIATDDEEIDEDEAEELLEEAADEETDEEPEEEEEEEDPTKSKNLRKAISAMTVTQKIKLAMMGGKEARSLLVMDSNKIVSSLVLKNPRITENEITAIAGSKSVRDDILRGISRDRKFMKSYVVKKALVENPKTPPAISMQLLPQMRDNDLKKLAKSKSVSSAIAQQARRMVMKKR